MKKIFKIAALLLLAGTLNSCRKTLDVNQNPNNPTDVTVEVLLPSVQASIGQQLGNYFQVAGCIWAQYWTQNPNSSQYRPFEQYQPGPSSANTAWAELYAGALTDINKILVKTDTIPALQNYKAIALILKGYTYQLLTDNFGDIPFTEALMGDKGISSPHYDPQQVVYNGIIEYVKEGRDLLDDGMTHPGSEDLIYQGNLENWDRFANTLLLRMYLRLAYVNPGLAQQGIADLDGRSFIESGTSGQITYRDQAGNSNPLYSELVNLNRTQNLIASATSFDSLNSRGDQRIDAFYTIPSAAYGALQQGYYSIPQPGTYAPPGVGTGGLANPTAYGLTEAPARTAPVRFVSTYESYLLQAEAVARGWFTGDEENLYASAVASSFTEQGFADSIATKYVTAFPYPATGSLAQKLEFIITEKWYCMNGNQGIEAWTEWRRTGYPSFFVYSRTSRIGNVFPARLPYPEVELTRNLNFPGQKAVSDKVWWDVN